MQSAAARMQSLIDGLLSLSRVTTQGQTFVAVDLARSRPRGRLRPGGADRAGTAGRSKWGNLPTIQADPLQMRQLLQNLIANALKFHRVEEPPVVKISRPLPSRPRTARKPASRPTDEQCRIVVEDNGIGFEEKYPERIFGVFQRLHPRDVFEGPGIGLAMCRKIVERHGGQITAHSARPGQRLRNPAAGGASKAKGRSRS